MDLDIISSVQENIIGHCLCVLGDSMAMPVGSMVKKFRASSRKSSSGPGCNRAGGGMSPDRPEITLVVDGVEVKAARARCWSTPPRAGRRDPGLLL